MLRHYLGDQVFFKALHNYLVTNAYGNVEISDLEKAIETTSGKDLSWFFDEWFNKPGHPVIEIRQRYDTTGKRLYVYVNQAQRDEKTPVFKIPTELDIYRQDGGIDKHTIWLNHEADTFKYYLIAPPLLVNFDAEKILLCQKTEIKPTEQWLYQYYHAPKFMDRYDALKALSKSGKAFSKDSVIILWGSALHDPNWYIRKTAISLLQAQNKDIADAILPEIEHLAQKDKKSMVRAAALAFIQDKEGAKSNEISLKALHDSSYYVTSVAIRNVFVNTPKEDSLKLVSEMSSFDNYRSIDVLTSVADIYAKYAGADKALFFENMAARMQPGYLNPYLLDYLKFLNRMSTEVIHQNEKFILGINCLAKTDWEQSSCQYFLNVLAGNLSEKQEPLAKQMADKFTERAKALKNKR